MVVNTAIRWLINATDYNTKTIFRIIYTGFNRHEFLKECVANYDKNDEDIIAEKIEPLRTELSKEIKKDWFSEAKEEFESDKEINAKLYSSNYSSNPAGPWFERFNLVFDKKKKKFHLQIID